MMLEILRYVKGYVSYQVTGARVERFVNCAAAAGIIMWDARVKNGVLFGRMSRDDYRKIRPVAHRSNTHPRIIKKRGGVAFLRRYRGRYGIIVGAVLFTILLIFLSSFIWSVSVTGGGKYTEKIAENIALSGIRPGTPRGSINVKSCRDQLLILTPELSYATITVDGCFVSVDAHIATKKKGEARTDYPANIVAARGGTIVSIKPYYGVPKVKIGEAVAKGDMLISGTLETKTGGIIYSAARAEVMAKTYREISVFVPYKYTKKVAVGEPIKRSVLTLFDIKIPLFFGEIRGDFGSKRVKNDLKMNKKTLPVSLTTAYFTPMAKKTVMLNSRQATALAEAQIIKKAAALRKLQPKIIERKTAESPDGVTVTVGYECVEDIAKPVKIFVGK